MPPSLRHLYSLVVAVVTASCNAAAEDNLLTLGDSLSKEYEYEILAIGGNEDASGILGWSEILDARRNSYFDYGSSSVYPDLRLTGHRYNWSVPGTTAFKWWDDYLTAGSPGKYAYGIPELEDHVGDEAERIVIFLGSNDLRERYGDLYDGRISPNTFANALFNDLEDIVNWIMDRKRNSTQVVLVNVPHLGATPDKNDAHPYNGTKTGRVTSALTNLNNRLSALAQLNGIGYADIFSTTLQLVTSDHLCIGGVPIWRYPPRSDGNSRYCFLGDGLHPNMPVQAVFAQRILDAFNAKYGTTIPRLTNTEILVNVLGLRTDLAFDDWTKGYDLPSGERGAGDDLDGDGVKNLLEYALDMDPTRKDQDQLPQAAACTEGGQNYICLTWKSRHQDCTLVEIFPQESDDLQFWHDVAATVVTANPDGTTTMKKPVAPGDPPLFFRLKARILPAN